MGTSRNMTPRPGYRSCKLCSLPGLLPASVEGPRTDQRFARQRVMRRGEAQLWFKNIVASMNLWQSMAIRLVASPTATEADFETTGGLTCHGLLGGAG